MSLRHAAPIARTPVSAERGDRFAVRGDHGELTVCVDQDGTWDRVRRGLLPLTTDPEALESVTLLRPSAGEVPRPEESDLTDELRGVVDVPADASLGEHRFAVYDADGGAQAGRTGCAPGRGPCPGTGGITLMMLGGRAAGPTAAGEDRHVECPQGMVEPDVDPRCTWR